MTSKKIRIFIITLRKLRYLMFKSHEDIYNSIKNQVQYCTRSNVMYLHSSIKTKSDFLYWESLSLSFIYLWPNLPDGWIVLGYSLANQDKRLEAYKAYMVAAHIKDDNDSWYSAAMMANGIEQIDSFRKAIQYNPKDRASWHGLGNVLSDRKEYNEAVLCYHEALKYSDKESSGFIFCDLGICHLSVHEYIKSIKAFTDSIKADDGYAFHSLAPYIAEKCINESAEFAYELYNHLRRSTINSTRIDYFLTSINAKLEQKNKLP